jgi:hypothetical protein
MKTSRVLKDTEEQFESLQYNLQALDGNSSQEEKAILLDGMKIISSNMKELTKEIQSRRNFLDIFREAIFQRIPFYSYPLLGVILSGEIVRFLSNYKIQAYDSFTYKIACFLCLFYVAKGVFFPVTDVDNVRGKRHAMINIAIIISMLECYFNEGAFGALQNGQITFDIFFELILGISSVVSIIRYSNDLE